MSYELYEVGMPKGPGVDKGGNKVRVGVRVRGWI